MEIRTLNGSWKMRDAGKPGSATGIIDATVPGGSYTDLLAAGVIEDPYWRDNALRLRWVQDRDWHYWRNFTVPADFISRDRVLLRCHGLDTFCEVSVNGHRVARTDNMYRTWEFDVKRLLRPGVNRIDAVFTSVVPYMNRKYKEHPLYQWGEEDPKRTPHYAYIRKAPYQFGWDWSPSLGGAGIWKGIELVGFDAARFADVRIGQRHAEGKVRLSVEGSIEAAAAAKSGLSVEACLSIGEAVVRREVVRVAGGRFELSLEIRGPRLWWPNGLGDRPLYDLDLRLADRSGHELDRDHKRVGLRTVRHVQKKDRWGSSFFFEVNGVPVWGRGANWVPADCFPASIDRKRYFGLVAEMARQNMNILRVWGGGFYESDDFYDACDEHGVLVWQDFMFACSTYPAYDRQYLENVRREAEDNVRRIRHHASLCLWCGNNELEEGLVGPDRERQMPEKEYNELFVRLLPSVLRKHDPATPYIRSSGHSPGRRRDVDDSRDYTRGDTHLWWVMSGLTDVVRRIDPARLARLKGEKLRAAKYKIVWDVHNGLNKYEQRRIVPRFASELGRQSFPVMKTIRSFTLPGDRNPLHPVMEYRQMGSNAWMVREMSDRFMLPERFEDTVRLSQIVQGEKFRLFVENWRRSRPRCMGSLHWTCNDCWPSPEWSTIDYYLRRKASFYIFKRFYSPVLITGEEDPSDFSVVVHGVNDDRRPRPGLLRWTATDLGGRTIAKGRIKSVLAPVSSRVVERLSLKNEVGRLGKENLLLWLDWSEKGRPVSSNLVAFCEPKSFRLEKPALSVSIEKSGGNEWMVEVRADKPAFWVWLDGGGEGADWSDNYFHLRPGTAKRLAVRTRRSAGVPAFRDSLRFGSLASFYR